jgi:alkanesulfonate monooxygenase SsuD/methylene tetrahydromethanopterin reductase-like flavin-dependent oxidoreductase (luciferase family)
MQPAEIRAGVLLLAAQFPGQRHGDVLSAAVRAAVAAEQAGFDDVWFAEHHFMSYGVCPSAATLAAYVLGRTSRIAVGTAVSVLSTQHPVALAEQAALLDQVSGGRFWLGVGRGGPWVDLEVFGTGLARYETGFAEGLDLLLAASPRARSAAPGPHSPLTRWRWYPSRGPGRTRRWWWPAPPGRPPPWPPAAGCRCCSACTPATTARPR